jgi:drug/metabolite transporter (DMT)-like permease
VSRTIELIAGVILLLVGVVVLASEPIGDFIRGLGIDDDVLAWWPVLLVALSLFFLVPSLVGRQNRRLRAGMVIPGAILAGVGSALLYTSLSDRWSAWTYLWSVLPFSFGLGMYAAGWIADAPAFKWIGSGIAGGGVVAYLVFAIAFGGEAFRLVAAIGILALGLALTIGGLADRLSRKSPTV